jgi:hypothetical protein
MKEYTLRFFDPPKAWEKNPTYDEQGIACFNGKNCDTAYNTFYFWKRYKNKKWALKAYKKYLKQGKDGLLLSHDLYGDIAADTWFLNAKDAAND